MQSNSLCALAWHNINTTPQGQCKLCCNISDNIVIKDADNKPVLWNKQPIEDIWNGTYMQNVRRRMLNSEPVDDCKICYDIESAGNPSPRTHANRDYNIDQMLDLSTVATVLPNSFDLRLSTTCNLKCVGCWSGSSSKIAEERAEAVASAELPQWLLDAWRNELSTEFVNTNYIVDESSKENFKKLAPTLKRLYITGGEPTMDTNIYQYLDMLLDAGNDSCHVSFTTNCTVWNYKLLHRLAQFSNTEIQISIDGLNEVDEYIRYPTKWQTKTHNFTQYLKHNVAKTLKVYTVVNALNYDRIDSLIQWLVYLAEDYVKNIIWYPIILDYPQYLSVDVIPIELRQDAMKKLRNTLRPIPRGTLCNFHDGVDYMKTAMLKNPTNTELQSRLVDWLLVNDKLRNLDHTVIWPNLIDQLQNAARQ